MKRGTKKNAKKGAPARKAARRRSRASKKTPDSKNPRAANPAGGANTTAPEQAPTGDPESSARGRPTKYRPEFAGVARAMCRLGATDYNLAEAFGVVPSTVSLWQTQHPDFSEALRAGKGEFDDRVVRSLAQRAVGYSHDAVKILQHEGRPIIVPYVEHLPPDVAACKLWLLNRRPEEWRDKVEVGGKDGAAIPVEISPDNAADFARRMMFLLSVGTRALKGEAP